MPGRVIGHDHILVIDFVQSSHNLQHVHVAFVRIDLLKIAPFTANVAEMDVENFLTFSQITNHIVNLTIRVLQHLCHAAQTEIQSVVWAFKDRNEFLQPLDSPQHTVDSLEAFRRHAGIVRMAGESNLVLLADRNHIF